MVKNNKKPRLRFKGFTDEWEQRKLGEIAPLRGGCAFKSDNYCDEGIPIIRISNILADGSIGTDFVYYKEQKFDNDYLLENGSVLLAMSGATTGKVSILNTQDNTKYYQNQRVGYFSKNKSFDYRYIATIVGSQQFINQLTFVLVAGAQPNVSSRDIDNFEFIISQNKDEQTKIGDFFYNLDNLITLHQRKYDKLLNVKKALLDKMFPKNQEKTPKIRFKGFFDAWEQRKVSDLAYRYDNLRLPITAKDRISGRTPYYGANGIQDYVQGFTHEGEFVLIAEDGANDIKNYPVQYVNGQIWVNNHAHVLQANENNITLFIKYLITSSNIASILVGGGRSKLNSDALMNFEISIPIKQEQQKIAKLFLNLDNLIALHQRECEKLKNIKKALLDKMFV